MKHLTHSCYHPHLLDNNDNNNLFYHSTYIPYSIRYTYHTACYVITISVFLQNARNPPLPLAPTSSANPHTTHLRMLISRNVTFAFAVIIAAPTNNYKNRTLLPPMARTNSRSCLAILVIGKVIVMRCTMHSFSPPAPPVNC
jgi:hypothetical protein